LKRTLGLRQADYRPIFADTAAVHRANGLSVWKSAAICRKVGPNGGLTRALKLWCGRNVVTAVKENWHDQYTVPVARTFAFLPRRGFIIHCTATFSWRRKEKCQPHTHHILWLLFQDTPDADRDFLWRDMGKARFFILSKRHPTDPLGLFELETKPFEPELEPGDCLWFVLRANRVIATKQILNPEKLRICHRMKP
jgi:hypothetical protein